MRACLLAPVVVVACLSACGKGSSSSSAPKGEDPAAAQKALQETAVPEANKAVPADLQAKLKFTTRVLDEDRVAAVIPDGWKESKVIPGSFENGDMGFMTRFGIGSNCDGDCVAKDWAATVDKVEGGGIGSFTKEKDEKLGDEGRVIVAKGADGAVVVVAVWKKDSPRYFYCRARLDKEALPALPAFEKACRALKPLSYSNAKR